MTVHLRVMYQDDCERNLLVPKTYPEAFQFPGGEWDLRNIPALEGYPEQSDKLPVTLIADVRGADPNDLVQAALWSDVADRMNFTSQIRQDALFVLFLPYLPAARADRGVPLGSAVYSRLIRSMTPHKILAMDPHSPVVVGQLRSSGLQVVEHDSLIAEAFDGVKIDGVIAPDEGSHCRATSAGLFLNADVYYASKHRDFETGKLSGFKAPENLPKSGRYLVVDDICDGGGTFMGLAEATGLSRDQLALWVTHGIFSGKADRLREKYRWIATTDSHPGARRPGVATCIMPCFMHMFDYL